MKFNVELYNMQVKRLLVIIYLLAFSSQVLFGQSMGSSTERSRIPAMVDSSKKYIVSNPDRAIAYTTRLLELSIRQGDIDGQVNSYKLLGSIQYNAGKYKQALEYYGKVLDEIKKGYDDRKVYDVYKLIGLAERALGKTKKSETSFNRYRQKAHQYGDSTEVMDADNNLAMLYIDNKQYDQAIQLSKKNVKAFNSTSSNSVVSQRQQNAAASNLILGKAYYMKGRKDSAVNELNNSVSQESQTIKYNQKDAPEIFQKSDSLVSRFSFTQSLQKDNHSDFTSALTNTANTDIGNRFLSENNSKDAIKYLENSGSYKTLALAYEKSGKYENAIGAYKKYIQSLDEEINNRLTENRVSEQFNSAMDLMNRKVELLEKEKSISAKTIDLLKLEQGLQADKVKNRNRIIWLLGLLALVMSVVIYFIVRTVNEKRMANLKLEMKSLRSQMNPHFVFNALNSVNSYISQNDERAANRFLSDFSMLMREVLNNAEADFITLGEEVNLLSHYLKLEHDRFNDKFNYALNIDPGLDLDQIKIPSMMVQPFIENSIWHGLRYLEDKGHLDLGIAVENGLLVISVKDNGIGRKQSNEIKTKNQKNYRSIGIQNIYKRAEIINQVYKLPVVICISDALLGDPQGNTGTLVKISCPIKTIQDERNHSRR